MILKPRVTVGDVREMSFVVRWEELNFVADSWIVKVFPKGHKDRSKVKNFKSLLQLYFFSGGLDKCLKKIETNIKCLKSIALILT